LKGKNGQDWRNQQALRGYSDIVSNLSGMKKTVIPGLKMMAGPFFDNSPARLSVYCRFFAKYNQPDLAGNTLSYKKFFYIKNGRCWGGDRSVFG